MAGATMDAVLTAVDNPEGKAQRGLFKKRRGGVMLTREQVRAIKAGRKLLRAELKGRGVRSKEEFNLIAAGMGLYFDQGRLPLILQWLKSHRLLALLGSLLALFGVLFIYATVTQMRGHFTINMSSGMFREGFVLSETAEFDNPTTHLFATPAEDVPCISISHIPQDIDEYDGQHNDTYFAYTFYVRNEGESTVGYDWQVNLNSESLGLSRACWIMVFEDGVMRFYAAPNTETGVEEALPAYDDDTRGYIEAPLIDQNARPSKQYDLITQRGSVSYYRVIPISFLSETEVAQGTQEGVAPGDVHKYTVVIWLEGDDPDCTDDLIGGHVGMEFYMQLVSEESDVEDGTSGWKSSWDAFWDNLKFWKD